MAEVVTRPHGGKWVKPRERDRKKAYTWEELRAWQAWPLDAKVAWARERIVRALDTLENPSLAFSAGKDSTVLLHLLLQYKPDIHVIWGNTTIEFPECVKFARWIRDEWDLNFHEARPEVTFWWVVENYGWPLLGKTFGVGGVAHKTSREQFFKRLQEEGDLSLDLGAVQTADDPHKLKRMRQYAIQAQVPVSSACCSHLKEYPSQRLQRELGVDGVFLGILAGESRQRTFNFLEYGEWYYPASQKVWKCHPLAIWTDEDIWAYIRRFDVPYASLYDMGFHDEHTGEWISHKRNGCMFCGMDLRFPNNHLAIMRRTHPKAWDVLMRKKGLGKVLWKLRWAMEDHQLEMFEETMTLNEYMDQFPCAFDQI